MTDIVGKSMIALRAAVSVGTVNNWSERDDWPAPRGHLSVVTEGPGSKPFWSWEEDIAPFLERNPSLGKRQ